MTAFPADVLERFDAEREVTIEVSRADGRPHRKIIWVVVDGDDVFVRSVRGERGAWYRMLRRRPEATVDLRGERVAVTAVPADDEESIERCSAALRRKYRTSRASLAAMLVAETLPTTLRLVPRATEGKQATHE